MNVISSTHEHVFKLATTTVAFCNCQLSYVFTTFSFLILNHFKSGFPIVVDNHCFRRLSKLYWPVLWPFLSLLELESMWTLLSVKEQREHSLKYLLLCCYRRKSVIWVWKSMTKTIHFWWTVSLGVWNRALWNMQDWTMIYVVNVSNAYWLTAERLVVSVAVILNEASVCLTWSRLLRLNVHWSLDSLAYKSVGNTYKYQTIL